MNFKMTLSLAALLVMCASAVLASIWYPQYQGEQRVREMLKDPDAAMFRKVNFYRQTKGVCGQVNAKNSMGGYVGFNDFIVESDGKVSFYPQEDDRSGSLEDRLASSKKRLEYLEVRTKICPD